MLQTSKTCMGCSWVSVTLTSRWVSVECDPGSTVMFCSGPLNWARAWSIFSKSTSRSTVQVSHSVGVQRENQRCRVKELLRWIWFGDECPTQTHLGSDLQSRRHRACCTLWKMTTRERAEPTGHVDNMTLREAVYWMYLCENLYVFTSSQRITNFIVVTIAQLAAASFHHWITIITKCTSGWGERGKIKTFWALILESILMLHKPRVINYFSGFCSFFQQQTHLSHLAPL